MKLKNEKKNFKNEPKKYPYDFQQYEATRSFIENICTHKARIVEAEEDQSNLLKALRQPSQIFSSKILTPYFF